MARCSRVGSFPSTSMRPPSSPISPHADLIAVVFPAPSGPITPNISPASTASEIRSSAVVAPYFFVTSSKRIAAIVEN